MKKFKNDHDKSANVTAPGAAMVDIDTLPMEMLCHVLSFLKLPEQLELATVSRRWRQAVDDCLACCRHFPKDLVFGVKHVTDRMLERILSRLPGLHCLSRIPGTSLDMDIVSRHCPQLAEAYLRNYRVDVSSLERLCCSCPKLAVLTLPESCDDACIETVQRGLPELRSLDMDLKQVTVRCLSLLPAGLQRLRLNSKWDLQLADLDRAPYCPALRELDISGLWEPPVDELLKLLTVCPRLERINATNTYISDIFLEQLPDKTPGIRHLNLTSCVSLTEAGLKSLGRLKELRSLNLNNTYTTDAVLERLHGALHLTRLAVGEEPEFSEESLARLVVTCPSMREVVHSYGLCDEELIDRLADQLSPDRDVTLLVDDLRSVKRELPDDGPLHLAQIYDDDEDKWRLRLRPGLRW